MCLGWQKRTVEPVGPASRPATSVASIPSTELPSTLTIMSPTASSVSSTELPSLMPVMSSSPSLPGHSMSPTVEEPSVRPGIAGGAFLAGEPPYMGSAEVEA